MGGREGGSGRGEYTMAVWTIHTLLCYLAVWRGGGGAMEGRGGQGADSNSGSGGKGGGVCHCCSDSTYLVVFFWLHRLQVFTGDVHHLVLHWDVH